MEDYKDIVEEEKKTKPKLYKFPNWNESMPVFDFDDLEEIVFDALGTIGCSSWECST